MNIRKFFSIFDRSKEAPVAKPKRRKAKVKDAPKKGHWEYTGPQISLYDLMNSSPLSAGQKILISSAPYVEAPERKDPKNYEWVEE